MFLRGIYIFDMIFELLRYDIIGFDPMFIDFHVF